MSNRDTLAMLRANMQAGDQLMARALDELRQLSEIHDDIEAVCRLRSVALSATASFIVESRALLEEAQADPANAFASHMLAAQTRR